MIFFAPTAICLILIVFLVKKKDDRRAVSIYALLPLIAVVGAKEFQQAHPESFLGAPLLILLYPIALFAFIFEEIYRYFTAKRVFVFSNFMVATSFIVIFEIFLKLSGKLSGVSATIVFDNIAGISFGSLLHLCNALIMWKVKYYNKKIRILAIIFCIAIHYLFNVFAYNALKMSMYILPLLFVIYFIFIATIYRRSYSKY